MKTTCIFTPRVVPAVVLSLSIALLFTGCVSNKYKDPRKGTPAPELLNVAFAPSALDAVLTTLITYNGPGSWKRNAFWDEYVVTLHNPGSQPLTVTSSSLMDYAGMVRTPGDKPWALEKESKTLEQSYKDAGMAFVRYTGPAVLIVGAGAAAIASAGVFSSAAGVAAGATVLALPLYYLAVVSINQSNRKAMEKEFNHRRIELPLTLAPGETWIGSFFFPMAPSPRSLELHWSSDTASGEAALSLGFLQGLHLKVPSPPTPQKH